MLVSPKEAAHLHKTIIRMVSNLLNIFCRGTIIQLIEIDNFVVRIFPDK